MRLSCCKQNNNNVSGIGEGGLSCLFKKKKVPPLETEREAVSNVIIGLNCSELFPPHRFLCLSLSHEDRTSHIQDAGGAVYLQPRRSCLR